MRMRMGLFAMLATVGLILGGCGETKTTPPPGADTDTPTVDIDEGGITSPDEVTTDGDTKKDAE